MAGLAPAMGAAMGGTGAMESTGAMPDRILSFIRLQTLQAAREGYLKDY